MAGLFAIGVMVFVVFLMLTRVGDTGIFTGYDNAEGVYNSGRTSVLAMDNIMLFVVVGLSLFLIISSAFVFNNPAFAIIGFILLAIAITVSGIISNSWVDFAGSTGINEVTSSFPKINFLMRRLPFYLFFMGISSLIAMMIGYRRTYG